MVYQNRLPYDDRDSYANKRIDTPGILVGSLFRQYLTKMEKDMKNAINKEFTNLSRHKKDQFYVFCIFIFLIRFCEKKLVEKGGWDELSLFI